MTTDAPAPTCAPLEQRVTKLEQRMSGIVAGVKLDAERQQQSRERLKESFPHLSQDDPSSSHDR